MGRVGYKQPRCEVSRSLRAERWCAIATGLVGVALLTSSSASYGTVINGIDYPYSLPANKKYNITQQLWYVAAQNPVQGYSASTPEEACQSEVEGHGEGWVYDGIEMEPPFDSNDTHNYACKGHWNSPSGTIDLGNSVGQAIVVCPRPYMTYMKVTLPTPQYVLVPALPLSGSAPNKALTGVWKVFYGADAGLLFSAQSKKTYCLYPQKVAPSAPKTPELSNNFGFSETSDALKGAEVFFNPLTKEAKGRVSRTLYPAVNREELSLTVRVKLGNLIAKKSSVKTAHVTAVFPNGARCELRSTDVKKKSALFKLGLKAKNGIFKAKPGHCDDPTLIPSVAGGPLQVSLDAGDLSTPPTVLLEGNF